MSTDTETILLPGDTLPFSTTKIGPGLHSSIHDPTSLPKIHAIRAGPLHTSSSGTTFVARPARHYTPAQNDTIIAQVTGRTAETYRLDIAAAVPGSMDHLAFHNVNRKSRPNLQSGAVLYARVSSHVPGMEPELRCDAASGKSSGGFGVLDGGYVVSASTGLCARLLSPRDVTLQVLGEKVEYEVVVGMNGRIWIKADEKRVVILLVQVLLQIEFLSEGETRELIAKRLKEL